MPQPDAKWAAVRLELVTIIGSDIFETVEFRASFELNGIPHASSAVAVGRDVRTLRAAQAHRRPVGDIRVRDHYQVFLTATPLGSEGGAPNHWPEDTIRIFDGYVTGTGWSRGRHGAQFVIHAQHWLSDLHHSSAISGASHPGNPSDFTYSAGFIPMDLQSGRADARWAPYVPLEDLTTAALQEDLWERALKPWMETVSKQDPVDPRLLECLGETGNKAALDALVRMRSAEMGMDFGGEGGEAIAHGVADALRRHIGHNDLHTTLWGKLVGEWSPSFFFAVSPRVEDAVIFPFTGGLRGQPWAEIKRGDYVQGELHSQLPQILAGVGILGPIAWSAGGDLGPGSIVPESQAASRKGLAGLYCSQDRRGMLLLKDAPPWLADPVQAYKFSRASTGASPRHTISTGATDEELGPPPEHPLPARTQAAYKTIMDLLAQQWFAIESLKGRSGELAGRLRFDIAPGSQVRVESGQDPFVALDALGDPYLATVFRVTHLINAEAQQCGTAFSLAHIRSEAENTSDEMAVDRPPLYKFGWRGDSLLDDFPPNL